MVFKPLSHLARRSTKALAHGYAQSLAAASQSSYASGQFNHQRFGRPGLVPRRDGLHTAAQASNASNRPDASSVGGLGLPDGTLDAFASAGQRHQSGEEWRQYQPSERGSWRKDSSSQVPLAEQAEVTADGNASGAAPPLPENSQALSSLQALDAEAAAVAAVDAAIANEIAQHHSQNPSHAQDTPELVCQDTPSLAQTAISTVTPPSFVSSDESVDNAKSSPFSSQIARLEEHARWAEIPAVFEEALRAGHVPKPQDYNALIVAAVHVSGQGAHAAARAQDVFADMQRRSVSPDRRTFSLILEVLATRALEVANRQTELELDRARFADESESGRWLLKSDEMEHKSLIQDDSLHNAIRIFNAARTMPLADAFSGAVYHLLTSACAAHGALEAMIKIYSHMEASRVAPHAGLYPSMIHAFGKAGDLQSALETYTEYKRLAIADNRGSASVIGRADDEVHAALVSAYTESGKPEEASAFAHQVQDSLSQGLPGQAIARDHLIAAGIQSSLQDRKFDLALQMTSKLQSRSSLHESTLANVAISAADASVAEVALQASQQVLYGSSFLVSSALLAMHVRLGQMTEARNAWQILLSHKRKGQSLALPTIRFAKALINDGKCDEALDQTRFAMQQIRKDSSVSPTTTAQLIDECIDQVVRSLSSHPAPQVSAITKAFSIMDDHHNFNAATIQVLLNHIGDIQLAQCSNEDLLHLLKAQSVLAPKSDTTLSTANDARMAGTVSEVLSRDLATTPAFVNPVSAYIRSVSESRPQLVARWTAAVQPPMTPTPLSPSSFQGPVPLTPTATVHETFDPYAHSLDSRGSASILEELERTGKGSSALGNALNRFRNIRRIGCHPRYVAYAKLISAAAKEGRTGLLEDLHAMAQQDVPLQPQYGIVRQGWTTILDALVGGHLTLGQRAAAAEYHQQLMSLGAAPTANTFGLYITTLKESTKTSDEATEAVKIFRRAQAEGVEPTSFLYNALIGKLGKARRIDDCLFYFAEMRQRGIRPTSVTYGTIVNALCRVSDAPFARDLFDEMEAQPNYKPRPAPYNSMMQFFLTTARDSSEVLTYYRRMQALGIQPTMHTYKLLIDTYATLEPVNLPAAESVFDAIRATGHEPEPVHYAALIHAYGCAQRDLASATRIFEDVTRSSSASLSRSPASWACVYQAYLESLAAAHQMNQTAPVLADMSRRGVALTPYIANTLIHGWAHAGDLAQAKHAYGAVRADKREPSTYEAMTRALLGANEHDEAEIVVREMLSRGYPTAVSAKVVELLGPSAKL